MKPLTRAQMRRAAMQPIILDGEVVRFRANAIVRRLLDESRERGGFGLNELAVMDFPQRDWEQFYQLIGYSICGYHELTNVSDAAAKEASRAARKVHAKAGGCRDHGCEIHCGVGREAHRPAGHDGEG
jgi:hypothetical protein